MREFDFSQTDLLILAGDIHLGENGFIWISEKVKNIPVIYILGNHEYYKHSYPKLLYKIRKSAQGTNINILENDSVCIEGITFHGATLWTNFELFGNARIAGFECRQRMKDYQMIRRDPSYSKMRPMDTLVMHNESLKWFEKSLSESKSKTNIVVTHHAPSAKSIPVRYQSELISAAFASDLESFIQKIQPDLWIHGHVHTAFDYYVGKTRIICNPKGYLGEVVEGFRDNLIINISV